ncbi:MAG: hypothetical protein JAY75_12250 [Candidatus Thiodiazotropha taylori]|nr:hypothetical protein [Candidatus Thiodiazotropha taylori]MCW4226939.1 hypothetical protein [Candidatus Thiodiazotropha endolucinida]MCG7883398.1 hypothetical protein [Candidatus Thiodiazotropha taylori]MCG7888499.1 hypothetical protein [Candidatus Thiodiazotropha taylori]MCG7953594.1 hypothetical protein [Candidatus Thiodiazotropha taylori]
MPIVTIRYGISVGDLTRLLRGIFALGFLIAQAGWLDHLYHQHDLNHDEVCELCLVGHAQEHAATGSEGSSLKNPSYILTPSLTGSDLIGQNANPYQSRAPPHYF